jgi:hypothetical protein
MKAVVFALLLLTGFSSVAQDSAKKEAPKKPGLFQQWPALKAFHSVMSSTFHPSEEGNLQPIRTRSGEMVAKANELAKSEFPKEVDNDKVRDAVKRLQAGSVELDKMVNNKADDKEVKDALTRLHDVFHEIVGLCRDEKE